MLMGKVVSKKTYNFYEYFTASLISVGMIMFLSGSVDSIKQVENVDATAVGLSGVMILISYMVCDSFTSNWQGELFNTYKMSPVRMMAGVNLFSCLLTGVSLIQQGTLSLSVSFMLQHRAFLTDCIILSICSAVGQLFIYHTISKFGPVIFIIIMTTRQAFAVLLSCILYNHPIGVLSGFGVTLVFLSLFLNIYYSYRMKQLKERSLSSSLNNVTKV